MTKVAVKAKEDAIKIGIIVCDTVSPELAVDFGEYPEMIMASLNPYGSFEYTRFDAINQKLPSPDDDCRGYIITGSKHDSYADIPWIHHLANWIRQCDAAKKPVAGICFGHQIIGLALGGTVKKSHKGWGLGTSINRVLNQQSWMQPCPEELRLLVSHQDQVIDLPPDVTLVASSDFCPHYMLAKEQHIFTVQGHPEFSVKYDRCLIERRKTQLSETQYQNALDSLAIEPQSGIVMQWLANFFQIQR